MVKSLVSCFLTHGVCIVNTLLHAVMPAKRIIAAATYRTRCKANPECSPPDYPSNRLLLTIVSLLLNWFTCVRGIR